MARANQQPLEVDRGIAERRGRFRPGGADRAREILGAGHDAHAFPAAAGHGLHHDRIADAARCGRQLRVVRFRADRRLRAGDDGHAGRARGRARGGLAAHQFDRLGGGADERQAGARARGGELGVLGQEPVAGMDRVGARRARRVDQRVGAQVALARGAGADRHGLIGHAHVTGAAIALGEDRHRRQAQVAAGADDPHRDLAAVGDQDLLQAPIVAYSLTLAPV